MKNSKERNDKETIAFNRSKIYEKLIYDPIPDSYDLKIPWDVQQRIAETNGIHYQSVVDKLKDYPTYEMPVPKINGEKIMLDIGMGWGRWLVAGAKKGYIPIGLELRLEFCKIGRRVMQDSNINGYTLVADLENLPFQDSIFDLIWSFSVIQHTHKERMFNCLRHINRILNSTGFTKLEFPNKNGIRNKIKYVARNEQLREVYNNWAIRYYTPKEYKEIFDQFFDDFNFENHSFLGIGVLKEDLKYVSLKNKFYCGMSLIMSAITKIIRPLKYLSDSIYISASKSKNGMDANTESIRKFLRKHNSDPTNNLNIVPLLRCPLHGTALTLSKDEKKLYSKEADIYYPIEGGIPILIKSEAIKNKM